MSKFYFRETEQERCYTMDSIKNIMKFHGCKEQKVYKAKMSKNHDYFYCREFSEVGEVGEGCGRECEKYSPRNGKNGRCRYSANLYEPVGEPITVKI